MQNLRLADIGYYGNLETIVLEGLLEQLAPYPAKSHQPCAYFSHSLTSSLFTVLVLNVGAILTGHAYPFFEERQGLCRKNDYGKCGRFNSSYRYTDKRS